MRFPILKRIFLACLIFVLALPFAYTGQTGKKNEPDFQSLKEKSLPQAEKDTQLKNYLKDLKDGDETVREKAAKALQKMGAAAEPAIPILIQSLQSKRPLTILWGGSFTDWDPTPAAARDALVSIGPATVPALSKAVKSPDPLTRVLAANALWRIDKQTKVAVPVLFEGLRDNKTSDRCVHLYAVDALAEIGRVDEVAVLSGLLLAFQQKEIRLVEDAAKAIGQMGPAAKNAIPELMTALKNKTEPPQKEEGYAYGPHVRCAGYALRGIRAEAVPELVKAIKSMDLELRKRALWVLGPMGASAKGAVPALTVALHDPDESNRKSVISILQNIGPDAQAAVPELVHALRNDMNSEIRAGSATALGKIAAGTIAAEKAVPALRQALSDVKEVQVAATNALHLIEMEAEKKK